MININISIDTDNAAFEDNGKETEVLNIIYKFLRTVDFEEQNENVPLYDNNGNSVGSITITEDCEHLYESRNRCGASVCVWCDNHLSLDMEQQFARCFCGWSRSGGNGHQEMLEMGEQIESFDE